MRNPCDRIVDGNSKEYEYLHIYLFNKGKNNHTGSASKIKLPQGEVRVMVLGTRDDINGYGTSVASSGLPKGWWESIQKEKEGRGGNRFLRA